MGYVTSVELFMDLKRLVEYGQNSPPNWAEWAICVQRHLQSPSTYRKMNHISIIYILIGFEWTTLHLWNFSWTSNLEFVKCVPTIIATELSHFFYCRIKYTRVIIMHLHYKTIPCLNNQMRYTSEALRA